MSEEFLSTVIARADAKEKILDLRDNLVLANPVHYAMMHGVGGKGFAANSTIKLFITDYSKGTGEGKSVSADYNIEPFIIDQILDVCKAVQGAHHIPMPVSTNEISGALNSARKILQSGTKVDGQDDKITISQSDLVSLGKSIAALLDETNAFNEKVMRLTKPNVDYTRNQVKVNSYAVDSNGFAPCSSLYIARKGVRTDGQVSILPWTVKISNFRAVSIVHKNGTTTFDKKTSKDLREVFINVSDDDMYRICYRGSKFIETWDNSNCIPLIRKGYQAKVDRWAEHSAKE
jgi:hypothetical protein